MSVSKSLARIAQLEEKARQQAHKEGFQWKAALEEKVPDKVLENLKGVFCKAFAVIFEKGTGIIEKTYRKEELEKDFRMRDLATDLDLNPRDRMLAEASAELSGYKIYHQHRSASQSEKSIIHPVHHPTLPSRFTLNSRRASIANSIGSLCNTSEAYPPTISATASSSPIPL